MLELVGAVRIDVLWTLRDLRQPRASWGLYVNHVVMYESQALREAFCDSARPDLHLADYPDVLADVDILVREVRSLLPEIASHVEGGLTLKPSGEMWALSHYPSGLWQQPKLDPGLLEWTRPLFLGERVFPPGVDSGTVPMTALSPSAVAAVEHLDGLAVEAAYRRHAEALKRATEIPVAQLPPPVKAKVFVAYRRSHFETAKALFAILSEFGHHTVFRPFLDHHDMRSGEWLPQLFREIENSDAFMPLVSGDYAVENTESRREYEKAKEVAADRKLEDFFVPIFIDRPTQEVAKELYKFDGLPLRSAREVVRDNRKLQHFLRRVAASVFARGPA